MSDSLHVSSCEQRNHSYQSFLRMIEDISQMLVLATGYNVSAKCVETSNLLKLVVGHMSVTHLSSEDIHLPIRAHMSDRN